MNARQRCHVRTMEHVIISMVDTSACAAAGSQVIISDHILFIPFS